MLSAMAQQNGGGLGLAGQNGEGQQRRPPDLARLERSLTGDGYSMGAPLSGSSSSGSCSSTTGPSDDGTEERGAEAATALGSDARTRFSANKALFERMERLGNGTNSAQFPPCAALPCFYSPRLQRSNSAGFGTNLVMGKPPPPVPPKPANGPNSGGNGAAMGNSAKADGNMASSPLVNSFASPSSKCPLPGSPISQLARNFCQFASDVERIAKEPRGQGQNSHPANNGENGGDGGRKREEKSAILSAQNATLGQHRQSASMEENLAKNNHSGGYDAYWRRPAYYRDRLFGSIERGDRGEHQTEGDGYHQSPRGSESGEDSVPSEPRPSSASPAKKEKTRAGQWEATTDGRDQPKTPSPVETMRGLSPERDGAGRKISFSTAPIRVYKTHGVAEYDRRNDEIDPVASCAEYELERRLERMDLFDVQLEKGPEGLGVSIIGMGVGADAGLEKLGIFVKSITGGGAIHRDGRVRVCDQIVSVDGISLVGVSQLFAAQALRSTGNRVQFTIGRERDLDGSEVGQLIRQSLEQDRLREGGQRQRMEGGGLGRVWEEREAGENNGQSSDEEEEEGKEAKKPIPSHPPLAASSQSALPSPAKLGHLHRPPVPGGVSSDSVVSDPVPSIRGRIHTLEMELEEQRRKAGEMNSLLENTRAHYSQLESRYNQARDIVKTFQEREREMLRREESHVEEMRAKEREYAEMVGGLKGRIEGLERRLETMATERSRVEQGELSELRERLEQCCAGTTRNMAQEQSPNAPPPPPAHRAQQREAGTELAIAAAHHQPPTPSKRQFRPIGLRHAGLAAHSVPLSAASPLGGLFQHPHHPLLHQSSPQQNRPLLIQYGGQRPPPAHHPHPALLLPHPHHHSSPPPAAPFLLDPSKCPQSPIPRVSEPASPALPQKWATKQTGGGGHMAGGPAHSTRLGIFPLRRRFVPPAENEFWRENQEAQGLAVLQWSVDDVCQLLIHVGLEKYIPEFTVNQINGPKFLELDGSKLKAMGLFNHSERAVVKKRVKAIKQRMERERKALEKEAKARSAVKIVSVQ